MPKKSQNIIKINYENAPECLEYAKYAFKARNIQIMPDQIDTEYECTFLPTQQLSNEI